MAGKHASALPIEGVSDVTEMMLAGEESKEWVDSFLRVLSKQIEGLYTDDGMFELPKFTLDAFCVPFAQGKTFEFGDGQQYRVRKNTVYECQRRHDHPLYVKLAPMVFSEVVFTQGCPVLAVNELPPKRPRKKRSPAPPTRSGAGSSSSAGSKKRRQGATPAPPSKSLPSDLNIEQFVQALLASVEKAPDEEHLMDLTCDNYKNACKVEKGKSDLTDAEWEHCKRRLQIRVHPDKHSSKSSKHAKAYNQYFQTLGGC